MNLPSRFRIPRTLILLLTLLALTPRATTKPYATWAAEGFTPAECADGQAAPSRDPDRDGWPNLLEYALATDPCDPNSLPAPTFEIDPASANHTLPDDPRDAGVSWEISDDLVDWQPASSVTVADGTITAPLGTFRFIRLRAFALPGPMLDSDGDGLHDLFEESLALESAEDPITDIGDVAPLDDYDGDGINNIDEAANHSPAACAFPPAPLLDPAAVAAAVDQMIPPPVEFAVHTPLR